MIDTTSNQQTTNPIIDRAVYSQLLVKFQPKVLETAQEYQQAHQTLLDLLKKTDRSIEETAIVKLLVTLMKEFEQKPEKHLTATPHEILLHLMEENGIKQIDLVGKLGSKGVVSEIINGKRSISKSQAKVLAEIFSVSASVFI